MIKGADFLILLWYLITTINDLTLHTLWQYLSCYYLHLVFNNVFMCPERPDPPVNLRIDTSEVLARSVSIMWVPGNDNFGPIRNFTVQYRKQGEIWQTVEGTIKPQQTSYTVKG